MVEGVNRFGIKSSSATNKAPTKFMKFCVMTTYPTDRSKVWCKFGFDVNKAFPIDDAATAKLFEDKLTNNFEKKLFSVTRQRVEDADTSDNVRRLAQFQRQRSVRGRPNAMQNRRY